MGSEFFPARLTIFAQPEVRKTPPNRSVYPDPARRPCVARDVGNASQHKRSTFVSSMCCERLRESLKARGFTPILFDINVVREM